MKKTTLIIVIISLLVSCSKPDKKKVINIDLGSNRIEILDFYGKHRCTSCIQIEENTKATLNTHFQDDLKTKQLIFKMVQWDVPENEHLVDKFESAGTSLIVYRVKDGKEYIQDITLLAFKNCENPEAFTIMLKEKIDNELKKQ